MPKRKSNRGRRTGQLAKAHDGNKDAWTHAALASYGDFPADVAAVAFRLGKLAKLYQEILKEKRVNLAANRKEVSIPLPFLPAAIPAIHPSRPGAPLDDETFAEAELQLLKTSGMDVVWMLQYAGYEDAFRALGRIIEAAANGDAAFFWQLARRISLTVNPKTPVPLDSPAEPHYSALAGLKWEYDNVLSKTNFDPENRLPSLARVFDFPPGKRPPLHVAEIGAYVKKFTGRDYDDKTLRHAAKQVGIPLARQGRPEKFGNSRN